jgi:hypothetical protein
MLRRPIFWLLIVFGVTMLRAEGPIFRHKDGKVDQEFEQVYQDIRSSKSKRGVTDGSDAGSGKIGEYEESLQSSNVNASASDQYFNVTSISLTAGDWDIIGQVDFIEATATLSGANAAALSVHSGNTTTDHVNADNVRNVGDFSTAGSASTSISLRKNITGTTTIYLKALINYSAGTPAARGSIKARRIR